MFYKLASKNNSELIPASLSQELGSQACTTASCLFNGKKWTPGFTHARKIFYKLVYTPVQILKELKTIGIKDMQ